MERLRTLWSSVRKWADANLWSSSIVVYRVEDPSTEGLHEEEPPPPQSSRPSGRYASGKFRL